MYTKKNVHNIYSLYNLTNILNLNVDLVFASPARVSLSVICTEDEEKMIWLQKVLFSDMPFCLSFKRTVDVVLRDPPFKECLILFDIH